MIILTLRTDKPLAELGLMNDSKKMAGLEWQAHRELAETIHLKLDELCGAAGKSLEDIEGIVCFKGPGSFTGLRIGLTVANALSYSYNIPIVSKTDNSWIEEGIESLLSGDNEKIVIPEYGAPAKTTTPR